MKKMQKTIMMILSLIIVLTTSLVTIAQSQRVCSGFESRLVVDSTARVTPGPANNVRSSPDLSASRSGQIPGGGEFDILDGPTCADGFTWWQVNYDGLIGWTVEGQDDEYWLEPIYRIDEASLSNITDINEQSSLLQGLAFSIGGGSPLFECSRSSNIEINRSPYFHNPSTEVIKRFQRDHLFISPFPIVRATATSPNDDVYEIEMGYCTEYDENVISYYGYLPYPAYLHEGRWSLEVKTTQTNINHYTFNIEHHTPILTFDYSIDPSDRIYMILGLNSRETVRILVAEQDGGSQHYSSTIQIRADNQGVILFQLPQESRAYRLPKVAITDQGHCLSFGLFGIAEFGQNLSDEEVCELLYDVYWGY